MNDDKEVKTEAQTLLIYDSNCTLCERFKQAILRLDGCEDIQPVSIHDESIYVEYPLLNREDCQKQVHVITPYMEILKGPDAVRFLIEKNPSIEKFSWLIESDMGKKAINFFYKTAETYRQSLLNRCPDCKNKKTHRNCKEV